MKSGREHLVPLPAAAVDLLRSLPRMNGGPYVFFAPGGGMLSDMSISAVMRRMHDADIRAGGPGFLDRRSKRPAVPQALLDGRPGTAAFSDDAVNRAEIHDLIDKIEVVVPPHLGPDDPAVRARPFDQPVTVTVRLRDGSKRSETVKDHKGTHANPVTGADLLAKFADCTAGRLRAGTGEAILALLRRPDARVRDLMHLLGERA